MSLQVNPKPYMQGELEIIGMCTKLLQLFSYPRSRLYLRQAPVPQVWHSDSPPAPVPTQSSPPLAGAGLVHVLERVWTPPPQVTEHSSKAAHSDHMPST